MGLVLGLQRFARGSFYPIVVMLYAIPQATILPLTILVFGIGQASKIAFGFTHAVFPIIVTIVAGVQNVKPTLLTCARSMGASRTQIFWNVILPHMIPSLFTGMRLAMTADLLGVLLAELYVSQAGVGHYTRLFTENFEPAKLFALVACLAAIAVRPQRALPPRRAPHEPLARVTAFPRGMRSLNCAGMMRDAP